MIRRKSSASGTLQEKCRNSNGNFPRLFSLYQHTQNMGTNGFDGIEELIVAYRGASNPRYQWLETKQLQTITRMQWLPK
jgi:hypothetical protein